MPRVAQARLLKQLMPRMRAEPKCFRKTRQVHARPATPDEQIVSVTSDGEETRNVANAGDMVVRNLTDAGEMYIISAASFPRLYDHVRELADGWALYDPKGEILALEVSEELATSLGEGREFFIEAPWGTDERVRVGDYLASPLPALSKIYRIARAEFDETYSPADVH